MGGFLSKCRRGVGVAADVLDKVAFPLLPSEDQMTKMTNSELRTRILKTVGTTDLHLNDARYVSFPKESVEEFLASSRIDAIKYQRDQFDCDDFAAVLRGEFLQWFGTGLGRRGGDHGAAFGVVYGDLRTDMDLPRYHAMNFFWGTDEVLYIIEPQSDAITRWTDFADNAKSWYMVL